MPAIVLPIALTLISTEFAFLLQLLKIKTFYNFVLLKT